VGCRLPQTLGSAVNTRFLPMLSVVVAPPCRLDPVARRSVRTAANRSTHTGSPAEHRGPCHGRAFVPQGSAVFIGRCLRSPAQPGAQADLPPAGRLTQTLGLAEYISAMQRALRPSTVELGRRLTVAVGAGCPSFGGQRTVGSHRATTVVFSLLRRAAFIGCNPSRCVVSTWQVSALGHQGGCVIRRPAQPCVQADGPKAAAA
jgi:hypothetical protein